MAYKHGVYVSEQATSILPAVTVDSAIPFIVGTAPVNMTDTSNVNVPKLCSSYAEAVAAFGFVPAEEDADTGLKKYKYSISEFIYSQFALFGVAPVVIVNVLDPSKHYTAASTTEITISSSTGTATVKEAGILPDSVTIVEKSEDEDETDPVTYINGTDYTLSFDDDGYLVITSLIDENGDYLMEFGVTYEFSANKLDPSAVEAADIVGGVDTAGSKSGFELIDEVYPRFSVIPGILIAPGFSGSTTVSSVMSAKCENINGLFRAIAVMDIPTDTVTQYSTAPSWKSSNSIVDENLVACWPMLAQDGTVYHMSTMLAGLMGSTDADNNAVPYVSPSNKTLSINSAVLSDGTEVWMDLSTANYLNGEGIVTAINIESAWRAWGNRTSIYDTSTDPKDAFISVRRMFNHIGNTFIKTFWQRLDAPLNRRHVQTIVDSANMWLNGYTAKQYILGGRVEFNEDENTTADLMDGKAVFHVYITPPSPNREIDFVLEYDVDYISTLFA